MSRLTDLIGQLKKTNSQLASEIEREVKVLSSRREFGLNFERHKPEVVELPLRKVRKGDKVRILPERGVAKKASDDLWIVKKTFKDKAILKSIAVETLEEKEVLLENLIVVAEFRDSIYPGLISTEVVNKGGDKPFHTVINGENYHALKALSFTHKGQVDVIYIDPPYNTGAKDWKYNNDYVEKEDLYRHSKWLAFIERRLRASRNLLKPEKSVLIVTIDEKEYLRLGMLLEQTFPEARIQMVSTIIKPEGTNRVGEFSRTNEYVFFVMFGEAYVKPTSNDMTGREKKSDEETLKWRNLRRRENSSVRAARPNQFYAIFVSKETGVIHSVGDPLPIDAKKEDVKSPKGCFACFPMKPDGTEMLWGVTPDSLRNLVKEGFARSRKHDLGPEKTVVQYLTTGTVKAIKAGEVNITGRDSQGSVEGVYIDAKMMPKTTWNLESHNAQTSGTLILKALLPGRSFPFPKSLYAVEDSLRFFIKDKPNAIVLDFFSGSGTTAHAVMRLNRQDGGMRQSISITNNEVAASEHKDLIAKELRPGDDEWEKWGICEYITKPRIKAAIEGKDPEGNLIQAEYKFTDTFSFSEGFEENAEFFDLTYESPISISHNLSFKRVANLLWMRAGSKGKKIETISKKGWSIVDTYGVLFDLDKESAFIKGLKKAEGLRIVYVVTNDERRFQSVAKKISGSIETIRLYESYLKNFQFMSGE